MSLRCVISPKYLVSFVFDHINLDNVRRGEIHALLGENGAGKSTLKICLRAYWEPTSGELSLRK